MVGHLGEICEYSRWSADLANLAGNGLRARQRRNHRDPAGLCRTGDIPDLLRHLCSIRGQGATISEAEQVWVDGMRLINLRAVRFPGNGPVVNDYYGLVGGEWRVYVGRPAAPGQSTLAIAFHLRTGAIAQGFYPRGIRPHPTKAGQQALFNFQIIYP